MSEKRVFYRVAEHLDRALDRIIVWWEKSNWRTRCLGLVISWAIVFPGLMSVVFVTKWMLIAWLYVLGIREIDYAQIRSENELINQERRKHELALARAENCQPEEE